MSANILGLKLPSVSTVKADSNIETLENLVSIIRKLQEPMHNWSISRAFLLKNNVEVYSQLSEYLTKLKKLHSKVSLEKLQLLRRNVPEFYKERITNLIKTFFLSIDAIYLLCYKENNVFDFSYFLDIDKLSFNHIKFSKDRQELLLEGIRDINMKNKVNSRLNSLESNLKLKEIVRLKNFFTFLSDELNLNVEEDKILDRFFHSLEDFYKLREKEEEERIQLKFTIEQQHHRLINFILYNRVEKENKGWENYLRNHYSKIRSIGNRYSHWPSYNDFKEYIDILDDLLNGFEVEPEGIDTKKFFFENERKTIEEKLDDYFNRITTSEVLKKIPFLNKLSIYITDYLKPKYKYESIHEFYRKFYEEGILENEFKKWKKILKEFSFEKVDKTCFGSLIDPFLFESVKTKFDEVNAFFINYLGIKIFLEQADYLFASNNEKKIKKADVVYRKILNVIEKSDKVNLYHILSKNSSFCLKYRVKILNDIDKITLYVKEQISKIENGINFIGIKDEILPRQTPHFYLNLLQGCYDRLADWKNWDERIDDLSRNLIDKLKDARKALFKVRECENDISKNILKIKSLKLLKQKAELDIDIIEKKTEIIENNKEILLYKLSALHWKQKIIDLNIKKINETTNILNLNINRQNEIISEAETQLDELINNKYRMVALIMLIGRRELNLIVIKIRSILKSRKLIKGQIMLIGGVEYIKSIEETEQNIMEEYEYEIFSEEFYKELEQVLPDDAQDAIVAINNLELPFNPDEVDKIIEKYEEDTIKVDQLNEDVSRYRNDLKDQVDGTVASNTDLMDKGEELFKGFLPMYTKEVNEINDKIKYLREDDCFDEIFKTIINAIVDVAGSYIEGMTGINVVELANNAKELIKNPSWGALSGVSKNFLPLIESAPGAEEAMTVINDNIKICDNDVSSIIKQGTRGIPEQVDNVLIEFGSAFSFYDSKIREAKGKIEATLERIQDDPDYMHNHPDDITKDLADDLVKTSREQIAPLTVKLGDLANKVYELTNKVGELKYQYVSKILIIAKDMEEFKREAMKDIHELKENIADAKNASRILEHKKRIKKLNKEISKHKTSINKITLDSINEEIENNDIAVSIKDDEKEQAELSIKSVKTDITSVEGEEVFYQDKLEFLKGEFKILFDEILQAQRTFRLHRWRKRSLSLLYDPYPYKIPSFHNFFWRDKEENKFGEEIVDQNHRRWNAAIITYCCLQYNRINKLIFGWDREYNIFDHTFFGLKSYLDENQIVDAITKLFMPLYYHHSGTFFCSITEDEDLLEKIPVKNNVIEIFITGKNPHPKGSFEHKRWIDLDVPEKIIQNFMELYKYLPKTNCKICGKSTCKAFALDLLHGKVKVDDCTPILEPKYKEQYDILKDEVERSHIIDRFFFFIWDRNLGGETPLVEMSGSLYKCKMDENHRIMHEELVLDNLIIQGEVIRRRQEDGVIKLIEGKEPELKNYWDDGSWKKFFHYEPGYSEVLRYIKVKRNETYKLVLNLSEDNIDNIEHRHGIFYGIFYFGKIKRKQDG